MRYHLINAVVSVVLALGISPSASLDLGNLFGFSGEGTCSGVFEVASIDYSSPSCAVDPSLALVTQCMNSYMLRLTLRHWQNSYAKGYQVTSSNNCKVSLIQKADVYDTCIEMWKQALTSNTLLGAVPVSSDLSFAFGVTELTARTATIIARVAGQQTCTAAIKVSSTYGSTIGNVFHGLLTARAFVSRHTGLALRASPLDQLRSIVSMYCKGTYEMSTLGWRSGKGNRIAIGKCSGSPLDFLFDCNRAYMMSTTASADGLCNVNIKLMANPARSSCRFTKVEWEDPQALSPVGTAYTIVPYYGSWGSPSPPPMLPVNLNDGAASYALDEWSSAYVAGRISDGTCIGSYRIVASEESGWSLAAPYIADPLSLSAGSPEPGLTRYTKAAFDRTAASTCSGSTRLTLSEPSPASCNKDYRMRDSWACMASMDLTLERAPAGGKQYSPQNAYGITFDEGACLLTLRPTRSSVQGVRCFDSVIGFSFPIPYWAPTDARLMQGVFVNSPLNTYSYTHLKFNVKKIHVDGMGITFTSMASSSWDSADGWICSARYKANAPVPFLARLASDLNTTSLGTDERVDEYAGRTMDVSSLLTSPRPSPRKARSPPSPRKASASPPSRKASPPPSPHKSSSRRPSPRKSSSPPPRRKAASPPPRRSPRPSGR